MKKIILFTWLSFAGYFLQAQSQVSQLLSEIDKTYETSHISLSGNLITIQSDAESPRSINKFILDISEPSLVPTSTHKKINKTALNTGFEELISIRENKSNIHIMILEKEQLVEALLMRIQGEENNIYLYIEGEFSLDDIENLDIELEGMDELKKQVLKA